MRPGICSECVIEEGNGNGLGHSGNMAGMLLPAQGKVKHKALGVRCLSNERQLGLGFGMYLPDKADRLPFSPEGFPNMAFVDFYAMMVPNLPTNGTFYGWPTDKGPMNVLYAKAHNAPTIFGALDWSSPGWRDVA